MTELRSGRRSLGRQLLWLGAMPAIVMFVVLMGFFTTARLDDARRDLANNSQTLVDNLAPAVEYAVVSGNSRALEQILNRSLQRSNAEWIRVRDVIDQQVGYVEVSNDAPVDDGVIVFESDILQQPLDLSDDSEQGWLESDYDLGNGALKVGSVAVGVSEARLTQKRRDILWSSLAVGLALLAFTLLVINRLLVNIIEPIQTLSANVRELIARRYDSVRVEHPGAAREVLELEQNVNALAQHLSSLKESRDSTLAMTEQARERAESASRAKSEFLAVMSHELRTPLNGVLAMIELTEEEPLTPTQQDYLTTARRSTDDLLTIISDILDFSRMDRGRLLLENQTFDLRALLENCTATFRHIGQKQGLGVHIEFTGEWPEKEPAMVRGDAPRLRQVLASLLDNAIKFTDEGLVRVIAQWQVLEDDCVVLSCDVRDSGSGIPTERLRQIFDSFEQVDGSHSRHRGGTGIGLSLVQRLVELMGGHIRLETDLGQGSSFRFEVPFELPERGETGLSETRSKPLLAALPGDLRALVVEDNLVNQRVATALMSRMGFRAEAVSNGQQALEQVRNSQGQFAVILMDCHMPVMDGYEATRAIRQWEETTGSLRTPVIALTADTLPGTESGCYDAGMDDYLAKPVRKERLRAVLGRWVAL